MKSKRNQPGIILLALFLLTLTARSEPRDILPPWPEYTLGIWGFNETFIPMMPSRVALGAESAQMAESWSGLALTRDAFVTLPVAVPVTDPFYRKLNFTTSAGTLRFWFRPEWSGANAGGLGPRGFARLLELVTLSGKEPETLWSLYFNPEGTAVYLSGMGVGGATDFLRAEVKMTANHWHLISLNYDEKQTTLMVDAVVVATGAAFPPVASWKADALGLVIGSDITGANPALGWFDELCTFDTVQSQEDAMWYRNSLRWTVILGAVGTAKEEAVKQRWIEQLKFEEYGEPEKAPTLAYRPRPEELPTNTLWLDISGVTNGVVTMRLQGTEPDTLYEILSQEHFMTNAGWMSEGVWVGTEGQDWTDTPVLVGTRTNQLFMQARFWKDEDGNGLPDWWEMQVFGSTGNDGYADADGDGWVNVQEYQNGTSPAAFNAPNSPRGWTSLGSSGTDRTVQWDSGAGPVQNYRLIKYEIYFNWGFWWVPIATQVVSSATFSVTDTAHFRDWSDPFDYEDGYELTAIYAGGSSESTWIQDHSGLSMALIHGADSGMKLALYAYPPLTTAIRLNLTTNYAGGWGTGMNSTMDIPLTSFTNGFFDLPPNIYPYYSGFWITAQAIIPGGFSGPEEDVEPDGNRTIRYPFLNAATILKRNLVFTLQAQTLAPYWLLPTEGVGLGGRPGYTNDRPVYAAASFHVFNYDLGWSASSVGVWDTVPAPLHPWEINYDLVNLINPSAVPGCQGQSNSIGYGYNGSFAFLIGGVSFDTWGFANSSSTNTCPSALGTPNGRYTGFRIPSLMDTDSPIIVSGNSASVAATHPNGFGLPLLGILGQNYVSGQFTLTAYTAGASCPVNTTHLFSSYAAPSVQAESYVFTQGGRLADAAPEKCMTNGGTLVTNLLFASVGDPHFSVSSWLRYRLINGNSNTFGYVEQYFDKAYKIGPNGAVTTNQTGELSTYGGFFPTEPGPVAVVTIPNIENGQRGTGIVNVVKLQLDVNHDGVMDTSWSGPDNTSQEKPFVFWINNDFDRGHNVDCNIFGLNCDFEEDDLSASEVAGLTATFRKPDGALENVLGYPFIPSQRDLEDYTRLWIPGLSNLVSSLPTGYVAKLSLIGDGEIRLFRAYEGNGGTNYLFDETTASNQVAQLSLSVGKLTASTPIVWSAQTNWGEKFIWCGVQRGGAELHLQILNANQDVVADTAAYLDLKDIKEMYERWTIGDNSKVEPTTTPIVAVEELPTGVPAFKYSQPADLNTPYILHVHGSNMERWEKDRFAEVMYKRLYWQGYQGRFGSFRWPTAGGLGSTLDALINPNFFDKIEFVAWKSAPGLKSMLTTLNNQYPGQVRMSSHSMGNVACAEALKQCTSNLVAVYASLQGAVPSHSYDSNALTRQIPSNAEDYTRNHFANYWLSGSNSYFAGVGGAAKYVNFFNTNDYVLDKWTIGQNLKPDSSLFYYYHPPGDSPPNGQYWRLLTPLNFPGDSYEIFSFCTEARCFALGAQNNVGGVFNTASEVDLLGSPYLFGAAHKGHSGQFRSTNMKRAAFWNVFLNKMELLP